MVSEFKSAKRLRLVFQNSCRHVICAPGKQRADRSDVTCRSSLRSSNLYGFKICLQDRRAVGETLDSVLPLGAYDVEDPLHAALRAAPLLKDVSYDGAEVFSVPGPQGPAGSDYQLYVFRLFSPLPVDRDAVDASMLARLPDVVTAFRAVFNSSTLGASPTCSPAVFHSLLGGAGSPVGAEVPPPLWEFYPGYADWSYGRVAEAAVYLPVADPLTCPSAELDWGEFRYDPVARALVLKRDNYSDVGRVSAPHFYVSDSHTGLVCLRDYQDDASAKTRGNMFNSTKREEEKSSPKEKSVLYWVSLVSTIISLVFLFLSAVIYSLLASLRTVAGINNLVLIVALFGAQLFLQLGSDVGMADWLCQVLGVMTHFFWLVVMFAQTACTFHMFYTLSFPLVSHVSMTDPGLMTRKYAAYVLLTSAAFVAVTLAWQAGAEGRSGYGGPACYLTRALVRILTFALPLACTVLVNLVMFVVTILRLRSSLRDVSSTRSGRLSLVLYTKLSVFTGLTWLSGYLASLLASLPLAYVFAVTQGCQGLFVFLAFLANGRVLSLLRERLGGGGKRGRGGWGEKGKGSGGVGQGTSRSGTGKTSETGIGPGTGPHSAPVGSEGGVIACKGGE